MPSDRHVDLHPATSARLALRLGHEAPFSENELAGLHRIKLAEEVDPKAILDCVGAGVRALAFEACRVLDLSWLGRFPALDDLEVWYSPLRDISHIAGHLSIERADFRGCLIQDASPLLDVPELYNVQLGGNPLDEHSYREVLPRLLERLGKTEMVGDAGPYPEQEWLMMQVYVLVRFM